VVRTALGTAFAEVNGGSGRVQPFLLHATF
jgi:hypothetical protein